MLIDVDDSDGFLELLSDVSLMFVESIDEIETVLAKMVESNVVEAMLIVASSVGVSDTDLLISELVNSVLLVVDISVLSEVIETSDVSLSELIVSAFVRLL